MGSPFLPRLYTLQICHTKEDVPYYISFFFPLILIFCQTFSFLLLKFFTIVFISWIFTHTNFKKGSTWAGKALLT
jgi:hypothetical protein